MSEPLRSGTVLSGGARGSYVIDEVLGRGGFGITYLAHDLHQGIEYAIKEFFPRDKVTRDEDTGILMVDNPNNLNIINRLREQFLTEGQNLSRLRHQSIVTIIEMFEANGTAYMVMELIEGTNLKKLVKDNGPLEYQTAANLVTHIAMALSYLHSNLITHLDVKPENIILDINGLPKLIDFGLSRQHDSNGVSNSTQLLAAVSPGYTAIEQYRPRPIFEPRSDIYSLGATLYYLITGKTPPEPSVLVDSPELVHLDHSIPNNIRATISGAMQYTAGNRLHDMQAFINTLYNTPSSRQHTSNHQQYHQQVNIDNASIEEFNKDIKKKGRAAFVNTLLVIIMTFMGLMGAACITKGSDYYRGIGSVHILIAFIDFIALINKGRKFKWFMVITNIVLILALFAANIYLGL